MNIRHITISRGLLSVILLCFFLPFITVSCQSLPARSTIYGINLVTGGNPRIDTPRGPEISRDRIPSRGEIVAAFVTTIAALIVTFLKLDTRIKSIIIAICGGISFFCFLVFKSALDNEIRVERNFIVGYEPGFWLAWILFFAVSVFNLWLIYQSLPKNMRLSSVHISGNSSTERISTGGTIYCPYCGESISSREAKFCRNCGKNVEIKT